MKVFGILASVLLVPIALAAQSQEAVENAAASITSADIIHRIGVIAHDSMRGRETPSPELELTAEYIAREFQRFGLEPGGDDGTFLQRYPLELVALNAEHPVIEVEDGPSWRLGREVAHLFGARSLDPITAPLKVVWGAVSGPADVAPFDLIGAVVFLVVSLPDSGMFGDRDFQLRVVSVLQQRPAAVVLVTQRPDDAWSLQLGAVSQASPILPVPEGAEEEQETRQPRFILLEMRDGSVAPFLAEHGVDLAATRLQLDEPVQYRDLTDVSLTVSLDERKVADATAPNTVGILEGSDPELKHEYLVFTGHMDHVGSSDQDPGRCSPQGDDTICNGADDDASGTIAVVELAEAFSKLHPRPKRSMIFVAVSGEERGLWGSGYFAENPPVPIEQLAANLNADMVGRNWTDTIAVLGKERSDLGETLHRVSSEHPELNMTAIEDIWPEQGFFRRSDHYSFAQRGVPVLFFFNGIHDDLHQPSDEVDKIDGEKMARIVKLMFYLGLEVANAPGRPQWHEGMIP
jgi:hypothetical protein